MSHHTIVYIFHFISIIKSSALFCPRNFESRRIAFYLIGSPKGIRTPVSAVRGRCPRPLDDRAILAAGLGLEPRQGDPESPVLPLHHPAVIKTRILY